MELEFDRRVYRSEYQRLIGCGATWFRELVRRGTIKPGRRDPGGRREWWTASEVRANLERMAKAADEAAA